MIAAIVILVREIAVSGLREFLAQLQVSVPVSKLAKWKTTFQLVSLGGIILAGRCRNGASSASSACSACGRRPC